MKGIKIELLQVLQGHCFAAPIFEDALGCGTLVWCFNLQRGSLRRSVSFLDAGRRQTTRNHLVLGSCEPQIAISPSMT